jgi:hypothetical protein
MLKPRVKYTKILICFDNKVHIRRNENKMFCMLRCDADHSGHVVQGVLLLGHLNNGTTDFNSAINMDGLSLWSSG